MDTNKNDSDNSPASNSIAPTTRPNDPSPTPGPLPTSTPGPEKGTRSSTNASTMPKPETTKDNLQYSDK